MQDRATQAGPSGIAAAMEALKVYRDMPDGEPFAQGDVGIRLVEINFRDAELRCFNGSAPGATMESNQTVGEGGRMECKISMPPPF